MSIQRAFQRPYVISWNLTYRCNLACEHCYLDAGAVRFRKDLSPAFADRSELSTEECFRVMDQIRDFAPEAVTILTGGEPLLRRDILEIIRYGAKQNLWVVVGTNGILITENLSRILKEAGVRGMALSLDALNAEDHDRFRKIKGAWKNTVEGARVLAQVELPFIVQTTVGKHNVRDLSTIADFAYDEMKAKVFNLYFLVQTGRGQYVSDLLPHEYEGVLQTLSQLQRKYEGRMLVNAKCAPHYFRFLYEKDQNSSFLKGFAEGAGGCPAGTQYMGIRPNGDVTPCPYLPVFGGNLKDTSLQWIWEESKTFTDIQNRSQLEGRCGQCEFSGTCGGCRARAYGVLNNMMAEDPLCEYEPTQREKVVWKGALQYGLPMSSEVSAPLRWSSDAEERLSRIPLFVRGRVKRLVEEACVKRGISEVSAEELTRLRSQMPASGIFSRKN